MKNPLTAQLSLVSVAILLAVVIVLAVTGAVNKSHGPITTHITPVIELPEHVDFTEFLQEHADAVENFLESLGNFTVRVSNTVLKNETCAAGGPSQRCKMKIKCDRCREHEGPTTPPPK